MPRRTPDLAGRRLNKGEAEALLREFDRDPVGNLTSALRLLLRVPEASWPELVEALPVASERRELLLACDAAALDALAADLNELRALPHV